MKFVLAALLLALLFTAAPAHAQDVNLFPLRVVLEDRSRGAEVVVFNRGDVAGTYRIELSDKRMSADGRLEAFDAEHPRPANWASAADYVRFSPRQVTLAPGQSQSIRIAVRRPPNLPAGEYRSHLTVTTVPPADTGRTIESETGRDPNAISIRITPIYGISIPVIVRVGQPTAQAGLSNPRMARNERGQRVMEVSLNRSGQASVYGDLEVFVGGNRRVGLVRGIAVYPEIGARVARIPLDEDALRGASGPTIIRYRESSERENSTVMAEIAGPAL